MVRLTDEELSFFKTWGYVLKKNVLPRPLVDTALERLWAGGLDGAAGARGPIWRDEPQSWGPLQEASNDGVLVQSEYRWQDRRFGTTPATLALTVSNPDCLEMAHQLLGEDLLVPTVDGVPMGTKGSVWPGGPVDPAGDGNQGARGVYVSLPHAEGAERAPDALHTDGQPMMLGMVALLADSPKDGGSFKIWPGSHRRFYPLFNLQYLLRGTDMPRIDPKNRSLSEVSTVSIHRSGA